MQGSCVVERSLTICGLSVDDEPDYLREYEHLTLARVLISQRRSNSEERIHRVIGLLTRLLQATRAHDYYAYLSALWIFFLFNIIFRDIHEFVEPGFIEEIMTGTSNSNPITEHMLLLGGVMIQVPIAMVLLSRLLPYGVNRWANIIVAALYGVLVASFGTTDLDDVFHLVMESAALSFIIWSAWRWRNPSQKKYSMSQEVSS
ncbi:MAG: DUF6326 family protein [Cyanobacteria bacterium J06650_10]